MAEMIIESVEAMRAAIGVYEATLWFPISSAPEPTSWLTVGHHDPAWIAKAYRDSDSGLWHTYHIYPDRISRDILVEPSMWRADLSNRNHRMAIEKAGQRSLVNVSQWSAVAAALQEVNDDNVAQNGKWWPLSWGSMQM